MVDFLRWEGRTTDRLNSSAPSPPLMSTGAVGPISFFRSQLSNRRFGDETLWLLESLLVSRDVGSLLQTRSILQGILRAEGGPALREVDGRGADRKLHVAEFFVRAFALVGDVEAFDNAIRCIQRDSLDGNLETAKTIRKQRDMVFKLVCSDSVQAQAAEYLKGKHGQGSYQEQKEHESCHFGSIASSAFRRGIKTRNLLNLQKSRAKHTTWLGSR